MEDSLRNLFFAYDLIQDVFHHIGVQWVSVKDTLLYRNSIENTFYDAAIGTAVYELLAQNIDQWGDLIYAVIDTCGDTGEKFSALALSSVPYHFPDGYDPEIFLGYCALILGAAYLSLVEGKQCSGDFACETIASVLTTFTLTKEFQDNGGFERLTRLSKRILRRLTEKRIEEERLKEMFDSGKI